MGKETSDPRPLGPIFFFLDFQVWGFLGLSAMLCWVKINMFVKTGWGSRIQGLWAQALFLGFTTLKVFRTVGHGLLVRSKHVMRMEKEILDPKAFGPAFFWVVWVLRYLELSAMLCWLEVLEVYWPPLLFFFLYTLPSCLNYPILSFQDFLVCTLTRTCLTRCMSSKWRLWM